MANSKTVMEAINNNPTYKVMWQSGFSYRGATEHEVEKVTKEVPCYPYFDQFGKFHTKKVMTFEEQMQAKFKWAAAMDMDIDHENHIIHINGFSENDMY